ncbi:MAG: ATP-binding protein [Gemmatimonadota bacterium]
MVAHAWEHEKREGDWPEIFAGDEILTTAILDRLLHHVHIVHMDGRSYRLREIGERSAPSAALRGSDRRTSESGPKRTSSPVTV